MITGRWTPSEGGEAPLRIELLGSTILRGVAEAVPAIDSELTELVEQMFTTMYAAGGQGLAAPQVGRSIRVAVVDVPPTGAQVLINPRITAMSVDRARGEEGCLSIPGVRAKVERPAAVTVEALDRDGAVQEIRADGELARCLQHEIDHLDGVLFIDRLRPLEQALTVARYRLGRRDDRIRTGPVSATRP